MADAYGSGPYERKFMQVQVLSPAPGRVLIRVLDLFYAPYGLPLLPAKSHAQLLGCKRPRLRLAVATNFLRWKGIALRSSISSPQPKPSAQQGTRFFPICTCPLHLICTKGSPLWERSLLYLFGGFTPGVRNFLFPQRWAFGVLYVFPCLGCEGAAGSRLG